MIQEDINYIDEVMAGISKEKIDELNKGCQTMPFREFIESIGISKTR
jgi:hypothetical protein